MKYWQDEAEQLLLSHQSVDVKTLCGDEVSSSKRCSSRFLRGVRGLLVQIRELLEDGGDIRHPLPDLGGGAAPGEICHGPGPALALRVDVGDHGLALPAVPRTHDQLGVVLEVVDLQC